LELIKELKLMSIYNEGIASTVNSFNIKEKEL
jgi:hypothetical protein